MKTLRPLYILAFFAFCLFINNVQVNAQALYYGPDKIVNQGDSVVLRLHDYVGELQWQKSYNKKTWSNIAGATKDTLLFIADKTTYFRAKVTAGNCDPYYSDEIYVNVMKLQPNVANIDSTDLKLLSDSNELANGIYRYELSESTIDISKNEVLYSMEDGYAVIVDSVVKKGNEIYLSTTDAKLTDIIKNIDLTDSIKILSYDNRYLYLKSSKEFDGKLIPIPSDKNINKLKYSRNWDTDLKDETITIEPGEIKLTSKKLEGEVKATASGKIVFAPSIKRKIVINANKTVENRNYKDKIIGIPRFEEFEFKITGKLDYHLEIITEANAKWEDSDQDIIWNIFPVPLTIPLGPVPATLEMKLIAGYDMGINIDAAIYDSLNGSITRNFGVTYDYYDTENKWKIINNNDETIPPKNKFDYILEGHASAEVWAGAQLRLDICGVFGPSLNAYPSVRGNIDVDFDDLQYNYDLGLFFCVDGDISAEALGYDVQICSFGARPNICNYRITPEAPPFVVNNGLLFNNMDLEIQNATKVSDTYANGCGGTITNIPNNYEILDGGILYWEEGQSIDLAKEKSCACNNNSFSVNLNGLKKGTNYNIKSYYKLKMYKTFTDITKEITVKSDNTLSFKTKAPPEVNTESYSNVTKNSATITGKILDDGNSTIKEYGVYYSTNATVDENDSKCTDCSSPINLDGTFTCNINTLQPDQDYWIKAYGVNDYGKILSTNTKSFKTDPAPPPVTDPTIGNVTVTNTTETSATIEVSGIKNGNGTISKGGVCCVEDPDTPQYPSPDCQPASDPTGDSFSVTITGLQNDTKHNFIAYIENETGNPVTKPGDFLTKAPPPSGTPIVTITNLYGGNNGDAEIEYNIDLNSGSSISERGIILDGVKQPSDGTGDGTFTKTLTVSQDEIHDIQVYATNTDGLTGESSIKTYGWSKCYPKNEKDWTGYIEGNIAKWDHQLVTGRQLGVNLWGWFMTDLSNIPTNVNVLNIYSKIKVIDASNKSGATMEIVKISCNPTTTKRGDLHDSIKYSNVIYDAIDNANYKDKKCNNFLAATAIDVLQKIIDNGQTWFAIGLREKYEGSTITNWAELADRTSNYPNITVIYEEK